MGLKKKNSPLIVAHRGASMEAPENTIPAIKKAWDIGVDAIEVDLRQTKDKELVSVHDASLARISNKTWSIARSSYKTLKATDV